MKNDENITCFADLQDYRVIYSKWDHILKIILKTLNYYVTIFSFNVDIIDSDNDKDHVYEQILRILKNFQREIIFEDL